jgi:hypothetical protein
MEFKNKESGGESFTPEAPLVGRNVMFFHCWDCLSSLRGSGASIRPKVEVVDGRMWCFAHRILLGDSPHASRIPSHVAHL